MTNTVIAIDDLHPEEGWGCEGDKAVGYLEELNKEFGCKFGGKADSSVRDGKLDRVFVRM